MYGRETPLRDKWAKGYGKENENFSFKIKLPKFVFVMSRFSYCK